MESDVYDELTNKYPFLSVAQYDGNEYIGIMQNADNSFVSMYILSNIVDTDQKLRFLELGETWWWESNRIIPINIFLKDDFLEFKPFLKTFARKEFQLLAGPFISMTESLQKRIKRRQIQLVKNQN